MRTLKPRITTVKDVLCVDNKMRALVLSDGSHLGGIVDLQVRLMPDGKTVLFGMTLEAQCTIGGVPAAQAFQEAAQKPSIIDVNGKPLN